MVRKDKKGVHFGLCDKIPMSALMIPVDVHSGNTARLKEFDPAGSVKYDFALFDLGVFEGFGKFKNNQADSNKTSFSKLVCHCQFSTDKELM